MALPTPFLGRRDVPIRAAFLGDGAQIVAELFHGGAPEEPVAVVDFMDDEVRLENDHMRDHGIVHGIGVFGDVEILLDDASGSERKGQWAPTPLRYSFVSVMLSVLIVTSRQ